MPDLGKASLGTDVGPRIVLRLVTKLVGGRLCVRKFSRGFSADPFQSLSTPKALQE